MQPKAGLKTTEFWLTIGTIIFSIVEDNLKINLPKEPLYAIIAYVLTRGWIKTSAAVLPIK